MPTPSTTELYVGVQGSVDGHTDQVACPAVVHAPRAWPVVTLPLLMIRPPSFPTLKPLFGIPESRNSETPSAMTKAPLPRLRRFVIRKMPGRCPAVRPSVGLRIRQAPFATSIRL